MPANWAQECGRAWTGKGSASVEPLMQSSVQPAPYSGRGRGGGDESWRYPSERCPRVDVCDSRFCILTIWSKPSRRRGRRTHTYRLPATGSHAQAGSARSLKTSQRRGADPRPSVSTSMTSVRQPNYAAEAVLEARVPIAIDPELIEWRNKLEQAAGPAQESSAERRQPGLAAEACTAHLKETCFGAPKTARRTGRLSDCKRGSARCSGSGANALGRDRHQLWR